MDTAILISVALINLLLGSFVLLKNPRNRINISFSIVAFGITIWVAAWAIDFLVSDIDSKLFWARMMLAGPSVIPSAFLYFSMVFPKTEIKINRLILFLFFIIPSIILLSLVPTDMYVKTVKIAPWGIDFTPGAGYLPNMLFFSVYLGLAFIILARKLLRYKGLDRERIRYLFVGTFITAFIGILANFLLPIIGITQFNKFGPMSTTVLVAFTSYAIIKHHLMDISVIISRTTAWILTVAFLGSIYAGLVWLYRIYISTGIDLIFLTWTILYGILVGETFHRIRLFIQTTSDKVFLRGKYDYYKELSDITTQITKTLSMENILNTLHRAFFEVLEVSNPRIYLPEDFDKPEIRELLTIKELSFRGEDLIIPCLLEDRLIALIILGKKLSEDPYTEEDLRLLRALASQTAVALDHTRTYEQIKKDFETNQKKLYEAERQLERSQRLASLGTLIAGVTHEIRNPMTVIRARMENLFDQPRDENYLRFVQKVILESVDRVESIIQGMLGIVRQKKEKKLEPINLNQAIEKALEFFPLSRIRLVKELSQIPTIKGDPNELREIFVNLIQNAVEAMPEGGTLAIKTYAIEGKACAEVSDTGVGIAKENLERIFDPFFSTRHEGTGLGLSIVYRIVREHGGDIKVESEVGKGTVIKLSFPA